MSETEAVPNEEQLLSQIPEPLRDRINTSGNKVEKHLWLHSLESVDELDRLVQQDKKPEIALGVDSTRSYLAQLNNYMDNLWFSEQRSEDDQNILNNIMQELKDPVASTGNYLLGDETPMVVSETEVVEATKKIISLYYQKRALIFGIEIPESKQDDTPVDDQVHLPTAATIPGTQESLTLKPKVVTSKRRGRSRKTPSTVIKTAEGKEAEEEGLIDPNLLHPERFWEGIDSEKIHKLNSDTLEQLNLALQAYDDAHKLNDNIVEVDNLKDTADGLETLVTTLTNPDNFGSLGKTYKDLQDRIEELRDKQQNLQDAYLSNVPEKYPYKDLKRIGEQINELLKRYIYVERELLFKTFPSEVLASTPGKSSKKNTIVSEPTKIKSSDDIATAPEVIEQPAPADTAPLAEERKEINKPLSELTDDEIEGAFNQIKQEVEFRKNNFESGNKDGQLSQEKKDERQAELRESLSNYYEVAKEQVQSLVTLLDVNKPNMDDSDWDEYEKLRNSLERKWNAFNKADLNGKLILKRAIDSVFYDFSGRVKRVEESGKLIVPSFRPGMIDHFVYEKNSPGREPVKVMYWIDEKNGNLDIIHNGVESDQSVVMSDFKSIDEAKDWLLDLLEEKQKSAAADNLENVGSKFLYDKVSRKFILTKPEKKDTAEIVETPPQEQPEVESPVITAAAEEVEREEEESKIIDELVKLRAEKLEKGWTFEDSEDLVSHDDYGEALRTWAEKQDELNSYLSAKLSTIEGEVKDPIFAQLKTNNETLEEIKKKLIETLKNIGLVDINVENELLEEIQTVLLEKSRIYNSLRKKI